MVLPPVTAHIHHVREVHTAVFPFRPQAKETYSLQPKPRHFWKGKGKLFIITLVSAGSPYCKFRKCHVLLSLEDAQNGVQFTVGDQYICTKWLNKGHVHIWEWLINYSSCAARELYLNAGEINSWCRKAASACRILIFTERMKERYYIPHDIKTNIDAHYDLLSAILHLK